MTLSTMLNIMTTSTLSFARDSPIGTNIQRTYVLTKLYVCVCVYKKLIEGNTKETYVCVENKM